MTTESSVSANEGTFDIQVLLGKQNLQFRALTEALKDSLSNLGSALDNSGNKLSKSIDKEIDKINNLHTGGQPKDLTGKGKRLVLPPVISMEKGG